MHRIKELDSIRGLSAIVILLFHLRAQGAFALGWSAVDMFFVLSGFLITSIILDKKDSPGFLKAFYARRTLRIWPAYYVSLLALVVIDRTLAQTTPPGYLPYYATFTQSTPLYWFAKPPASPEYFQHVWTLAIEEQFYLFWPLLVGLTGRRGLMPMAAVLMGVSVSARALGLEPHLLLARCDGLVAGAFLAALLNDRAWVEQRLGVLRWGFGLMSLVMLAYLIGREGGSWVPGGRLPGSTILGLNLLFAGLVGLLIVWQGHPALAFLRDRRLCHLGQISYGLYIFHGLVYFLLNLLADRLGFDPAVWWWDGLKLLTAFGVATASWYGLEQPFLNLKDRFSYHPAPEPQTISPALRPELG